MSKKYLLSLLITGLTACSTGHNTNDNSIFAQNFNSPIYSNYQGPITFTGINDYWQFTNKEIIDGTEVNVYIPNIQNENTWTEKIETTHTVVTPKTTVYKYYSQIIYPEINDQCYYESPNFHIIHQTIYDLTFAYNMKNCGKNADQTVVGRIMRTPTSIDTITYTIKNNELIEPQENQMVQLTDTARIIKD